jgi:hypothetical protein
MPKKVLGPTCYGVKQFQFLKHGILPIIMSIPCSTGGGV